MSAIMEWMGSAMETHLQSLSHNGACGDVSVFGLDTLQVVGILLHQLRTFAVVRMK